MWVQHFTVCRALCCPCPEAHAKELPAAPSLHKVTGTLPSNERGQSCRHRVRGRDFAPRPSGHTQTRDPRTLLGAVGRGRKPKLSSVFSAALCPSQLPAFSIIDIQFLLSSLLPLVAFCTAHAEEDAAEWKMGLERDAPHTSSKR